MSRATWTSSKEMLEHVYAIGAYLIAKKIDVGHGHFREWVEGPDGPPFSYRTARLYMQLHREMDRSGEALEAGYDPPPAPPSLRQLAAATRTKRGRLRPAIGAPSAIALPPPVPQDGA